MEQFRDIITLLFGISILVYPLFFVPMLRNRRDMMSFIIATATLSGILCLTLLWWDDFSTWRLMEYYGWNPDGICDSEYFQNVQEVDRERVQKLWNHNMGVGWPIKAFIHYLIILPCQWLLSAVEYYTIKLFSTKKQLQKI